MRRPQWLGLILLSLMLAAPLGPSHAAERVFHRLPGFLRRIHHARADGPECPQRIAEKSTPQKSWPREDVDAINPEGKRPETPARTDGDRDAVGRNTADPFGASQDRAIHRLNEGTSGPGIESDQRADRLVEKAGGISDPDPSALADSLRWHQPQPEGKRDGMRRAIFYFHAGFRFENPGFFFPRTKLDAYFVGRHAHAKAFHLFTEGAADLQWRDAGCRRAC